MTAGRQAYIRVGRIVGPFALIGLKLFTLLTGRQRVRVIVMNEQAEVLLVRGIISHRGWWTLPGGGVNRHEKLVDAAVRELHEETGIKKQSSDFHYLRTVKKQELGHGYDAPLFYVAVKKSDLPKAMYNPTEIADLAWFKLHELPRPLDPIVTTGIAEYTSDKIAR